MRRKSIWAVLVLVVLALTGVVFLRSRSGPRPVRARDSVSGSGGRVTRDTRAASRREGGGMAAAATTTRDEDLRASGVHAPEAIPDEYVLSFYSERDRAAFLQIARSLGVDVLDTMKLGFSVRIRAGRALLDTLRKQAPLSVEFGSNYVVRNPRLPLLDPRAPEGEYAVFGGHVLQWLGVQDNVGWGGGVTVAVLDTGVNAHPALAASEVTRLDLLGGDGMDPATDSAHGTAVASLIAGSSELVNGIAPAVNLLSVRVVSADGSSDVFTAAKGIVMAVDAGADIINCSFGTRTDSFLLRAAVAYAASHGAVVVASTGNESVQGVSYPAGYPGVVAVSAVDARGEHLYFSNRGDAVDIAAPGLGIEAAWTGDSDMLFSGTSASAPLVSGAIAAVMSGNPGLSAVQAAAIVEDYSNDAEAPGRDEELGNGIMNMRRVEQRNEPGIYDVTVGRPYLVPAGDGTDIKVSVYAQNTGTEVLGKVDLVVDINGARYSLPFQNVQVGQTVSHDILLAGAELEVEGSISIDARASIEGVDDRYPADNTRKVQVVYKPPDL